MSDNKKYYYLKLKDNFFDSDEIKVLEAMPNGVYYSNLLLKLYLKSLKSNGALMFNDLIPFNVEMIAAVTNLNIDTVRSGLDVLSKMRLIDKLENGVIFMSNIQNFIGKSSTEADRIRNYRQNIEQQKLLDSNKSNSNECTNSVQMYEECTPEIRDKRLEIRDNNISKDILCSNDLLRVIETWNKLNLSKLVHIKTTSTRYKLLKARVKDVGFEKLIEVIESISKSDFLKGQNKTGWTITFDWLIKPNNFTKVLEGNYINKEVNNNGTNNGQRNYRPSSGKNNGSSENKFAGFRAPEVNYEFTDEEQRRIEEELI